MAPKMLHSIVREPRSSQASGGVTLCLLHGLGADENDLIGLSPYLDPRLKIESVRAPLQSPWGGYSWFGIDFVENQLVVDTDDVRRSLGALTEFLRQKEGPVILGGFSQGAMMTLGVALDDPDLIRGAVVLSGGIVPPFEPRSTDVSIFQSHGTHDPVVPLTLGRETAEALKALDVEVEYREYQMAHEISAACLDDLSEWITARIDKITG